MIIIWILAGLNILGAIGVIVHLVLTDIGYYVQVDTAPLDAQKTKMQKFRKRFGNDL